jgi:hypothetical protein
MIPGDLGQSMITTNPRLSATWSAAYNAINIANNVLANIEKVAAAIKTGERRSSFYQGCMHFELVRLFARDYTDGDPNMNPEYPL